MIFAGKINKIPEYYMIFARKMPKFYIKIARKIFFSKFWGSHAPCPVPSLMLIFHREMKRYSYTYQALTESLILLGSFYCLSLT